MLVLERLAADVAGERALTCKGEITIQSPSEGEAFSCNKITLCFRQIVAVSTHPTSEVQTTRAVSGKWQKSNATRQSRQNLSPRLTKCIFTHRCARTCVARASSASRTSSRTDRTRTAPRLPLRRRRRRPVGAPSTNAASWRRSGRRQTRRRRNRWRLRVRSDLPRIRAVDARGRRSTCCSDDKTSEGPAHSCSISSHFTLTAT